MSVTTTVTIDTIEERPIVASVQQPAEPEPYRYAHLLPSFSQETYPPLTLFEHIDPGSRALSHPDPRSFLAQAKSVTQLTPNLGSEIHGVSLASLSSAERDQLALEVRCTSARWSFRNCFVIFKVARRGLLVFRDQQEFIEKGPEFYLDWGRHFGRYG